MKNNDENLNIFEMLDEPEDTLPKIDVVNMNFENVQVLNWKELFVGYNKIKAITYSSGINFAFSFIDMFEDVEIIFGCEHVISYTFQEIIAFQNYTIDKIRNKMGQYKERILSRIEKGNLRFFVAKNQLSHEKIYLLESKEGKKRVIIGSANLSYNAFNGIQRENLSCLDGEEAYDYYLNRYEELKINSTNDISKKALIKSNLNENLEELPIVEEIRTSKAIVLDPIKDNEEVEYILKTQNILKKLNPFAPKVDKKGKVLIDADFIKTFKRKLKEDERKTKELRQEYPQLLVDIEKHNVFLNEMKIDLNPTYEEINNDVNLFLKYMDGYNKFHGNFEELQYRYFEFANWFFCSPFMATMRDTAARYNHNRLPYPVFGLLYGQSKAGKTSFLETLLIMMIGQKPKLTGSEFTRKNIESLKYQVQGAPIIVDDLMNDRFRAHAAETIKNEDFGLSSHMLNYPAVVISANQDVKAVAPEIVRRTIICRVEAGLTNTEVIQGNIVKSVQNKISTAFYREYLRRMLEQVPELIELLKDDKTELAPDILKLSSEILVSIIKEHAEIIPPYIRVLNIDNYFDEKVTGKHAIKVIKNAWKINKKLFSISKKTNELRYNAGETYDAERLMKELPETLEATRSREWITMNLKEARKFFGEDFNKSLFLR